MTPTQAKRLIVEKIEALGLEPHTLKAKTVSFEGFGYRGKLFVTIYGWKPNPKAHDLKEVGRANGFIVSFA